MDALHLLRAYLAGDEQAIMSRAHVEAVIAEIERLRVGLEEAADEIVAQDKDIDRLIAENEEGHRAVTLAGKTNLSLMKACEEYRAALAAERERAKSAECLRDEAEANLAETRKGLSAVIRERDAVASVITKLREALEPFARWCAEMEGEGPRLADEARVSSDITMGDCRRAKSALQELGRTNHD
jgi:hypothetical protein